MLVLSRKAHESILIMPDAGTKSGTTLKDPSPGNRIIEIVITEIGSKHVQIGITAPTQWLILRGELARKK